MLPEKSYLELFFKNSTILPLQDLTNVLFSAKILTIVLLYGTK